MRSRSREQCYLAVQPAMAALRLQSAMIYTEHQECAVCPELRKSLQKRNTVPSHSHPLDVKKGSLTKQQCVQPHEQSEHAQSRTPSYIIHPETTSHHFACCNVLLTLLASAKSSTRSGREAQSGGKMVKRNGIKGLHGRGTHGCA